jgi:predicted regulator of amino acid metabolism with ACT domain
VGNLGHQAARLAASKICDNIVKGLCKDPETEVAAIARANGLTDERVVKTVVKDAATCDFDLRRVRREIHKQKRLAAIASK